MRPASAAWCPLATSERDWHACRSARVSEGDGRFTGGSGDWRSTAPVDGDAAPSLSSRRVQPITSTVTDLRIVLSVRHRFVGHSSIIRPSPKCPPQEPADGFPAVSGLYLGDFAVGAAPHVIDSSPDGKILWTTDAGGGNLLSFDISALPRTLPTPMDRAPIGGRPIARPPRSRPTHWSRA